MDVNTKILRLLKVHNYPLSKLNIAAKLGVDDKMITKSLIKLKQDGLVSATQSGDYVLNELETNDIKVGIKVYVSCGIDKVGSIIGLDMDRKLAFISFNDFTTIKVPFICISIPKDEKLSIDATGLIMN